MGSISTQDLNLRPHAMQAIGDLIRESGEEKIEQLMKSLKEEKDKIEVFKRELPLTMQILSDGEWLWFNSVFPAFFFLIKGLEYLFTLQFFLKKKTAIDGFKKEMERRQEERLKELTPVKSGLVEKSVIKSEKDGLSEKINWLSSAQLWVDNPSSSNTSSQEKTSLEVCSSYWRTWYSEEEEKLIFFKKKNILMRFWF